MKLRIVAVAVLLLSIVAAVVFLPRGPVAPSSDTAAVAVGGGSDASADASFQSKRSARPKPARKRRPRAERLSAVRATAAAEDDAEELTEEEEALLDAIYEALNVEDEEALRALNAKAAHAPKSEIREALVTTLGWFGSSFLPELTPFLADPDEDIRFEALVQWQNALYQIEDAGEKLAVCELAFGSITDKDALEEIADEFNDAEEADAVVVLARIITDNRNPAGVAVAKETYEFVTGDEWAGLEAAEAWLKENAEGAEDGEESDPAEEPGEEGAEI